VAPKSPAGFCNLVYAVRLTAQVWFEDEWLQSHVSPEDGDRLFLYLEGIRAKPEDIVDNRKAEIPSDIYSIQERKNQRESLILKSWQHLQAINPGILRLYTDTGTMSFLRPEHLCIIENSASAWSGMIDVTIDGTLMHGEVLVGLPDLENLLADRTVRPARDITTSPTTAGRSKSSQGKGGGVLDYELMRKFVTAACHILYNDRKSVPANELAFRKAILDRMGELDWRQPSGPTAKKFSSELWEELHRDPADT
jgi:hypothetical protein